MDLIGLTMSSPAPQELMDEIAKTNKRIKKRLIEMHLDTSYTKIRIEEQRTDRDDCITLKNVFNAVEAYNNRIYNNREAKLGVRLDIRTGDDYTTDHNNKDWGYTAKKIDIEAFLQELKSNEDAASVSRSRISRLITDHSGYVAGGFRFRSY